MSALSSNHFSHDQQLADAVRYMAENLPLEVYQRFLAEFPEWTSLKWEGSWIDTAAMGVDVEFASWATDWVEANTAIYWEEGEPWFDEEG